MLTPDQVDAIRTQASHIADPINTFLLQDIARRIAAAGQLTSTAAYEVWRAQQLGMSRQEIRKKLRELLNASQKDINRLLKQAAKVGYTFDLSRLPTANAIPFDENGTIQQVVDAAVRLAEADFTGLTQSIGFLDPLGNPLPLREAYKASIDYAFEQVFTGAMDYNTAIRRTTANLAQRGILTIDYASGVHTSLEAAVRRCVMGGLGLMVEQIEDTVHDQLGCDGWEISAHAASAPDHEPIQGKQYPDAEYQALNNSLVRRIGTLNCGHIAFPIILGVSSPQYTQEQLDTFREDNEKGVTVDGKHYTMYEATQMQRRLERAIRAQKRRVLLAEGNPDDPDRLLKAQLRLQSLRQAYTRFSDAAGLRTEAERTQKYGFGPGQAARAAKAKPAPMPTREGPQKAAAKSAPQYIEVSTQNWYPGAKPGSHPVVEQQFVEVDGKTYTVDGHNVVFEPKANERRIASLLAKVVGGPISLLPRVNNPPKIKTADLLFNGEAYEVKTPKAKSKETAIFNRVKDGLGQAERFIVDITPSGISEAAARQQVERLFKHQETAWVKEVVIVQGDKILFIIKRA